MVVGFWIVIKYVMLLEHILYEFIHGRLKIGQCQVQVLILLFFHLLDSHAHPCGTTCDTMTKLIFPFYGFEGAIWYCRRALLFLLV